MYRLWFTFIITLFSCFHSMTATTHDKPFFFQHLTMEDGLSNNHVSAIFQSKDGILWLGTQKGLNCYDGHNFRLYKKRDSSTANSIRGNGIKKILQDRDNNIWVQHEKGTDEINYITRNVRHGWAHDSIGKSVIDICTDYNQQLLILCDQEVWQYIKPSRSYKRLFTAPENYSLFSLIKDKQGGYYIGIRQYEVLRCDSNWNITSRIQSALKQKGPANKGLVFPLCIDSENRLWYGIKNQSIERYTPQTKSITKYSLSNTSFINPDVRDMIEMDKDYMLIATFNGLFRLDKETLNPSHVLSPQTEEEGTLNHFSIYSLYKDKQNILWVGTNAGGVNFCHPYNQRFKTIHPNLFLGRMGMIRKDQENNIWVATEGGGLFSYNQQTGYQENYLVHGKEKSTYYANILKSLFIDGDSIWCGNQKGEIFIFSIKKKKFSFYTRLGDSNILAIFKDSKQHIWIGTKQEIIQLAKNADGKYVKQSTSSLIPIEDVCVIEELPNEIILFGSKTKGIYIYHTSTNQWQHLDNRFFKLPEDTNISITSFCKTKDNQIWVTTENQGLFLLDTDFQIKEHLFHSGNNYLEDLYHVAEGKENQLWLMTNKSILLYDTNTRLIRSFDSHNGLNLKDFSAYSCWMDINRQLWFSGNRGIAMLDTENFPLNTSRSPIIFTDLLVNNRVQHPLAPESVLKQNFNETRTLSLNYNQTNIAISYTCSNFIYPDNNTFFYKMDGVDEEWIDANNRKTVYYSNLRPGHYRFHIKAFNNDNMFCGEKEIEIIVLPPFWIRWWAFLMYAVIIYLLIHRYVIYRQRKQRLEHELHLKQIEQQKAEELNHELQLFFTQVAHEFRTPLSLILNPLDEIQDKIIHIAGVQEALKLIRRNAQRLLALVNDLMDLRKIESGTDKLNLSNFDFNDFTKEVYYTFQGIAGQRHLKFLLNLPNTPIMATFDREAMEKVLFNLLSNAFKFTPEGGEVHLSVTTEKTVESKSILIEIKDTGIGISPEDVEKIFRPFALSRKDLHGNISGSGVGLSITRTIIEHHKGTIQIQNNPPHGTCIHIELPWVFNPQYTISPTIIDEEDVRKEDIGQFPLKVNLLEKTILLVDDNPEILNYLKKELGKSFNILTATNGKEALGMLQQQNISLVVSDVMMPEIDGIELCKRIKTDHNLSHLPIILLTAKAMNLYIEEGFQAGADDYIVKPFKVSTLKIRIKNILNRQEKMKKIYGKQLSLKSAGIEVESIDKAFVDKYIAIVKENISNPDFNIDQLCKELAISRANLYRKVKAITTLSPAEMIRNIRLECASELLRNSQLTATEIAIQVGFGSYSHFSDFFKSIYGISPKKYKEQYGKS